MTAAIEAYQALHAAQLPSAAAIGARLAHAVDYLEASGQLAIECHEIDEAWIQRFREWSAAQPIRSTKGAILRDRSLSTTEGTVAQLSAVINDAKTRKNVAQGPAFRAQSLRSLNQTPEHRSSIEELARMFRYCVNPDVSAELEQSWGRRREPYSEAEILEIRRRERAALHRYLIISVASLARPDAAHDFAPDPRRRQWNGNARILNLNPKGRRQTRKYRATVPIAWQIAPLIDQAYAQAVQHIEEHRLAHEGSGLALQAPIEFFVGPKSIRRAWDGMAAALGLPREREAGGKLIRRSMAHLCRARLPEEAWGEISIFMGHDRMDSVTDIYAPLSPLYLRRALSAIEGIIDEISALAPGAFALGPNVVSIRRNA